MLTALSHDQFADVDAIDAAIQLAKAPFGLGVSSLLAKRGVDERLVRTYEEVVGAVVQLLTAGGDGPERCSFSLKCEMQFAAICEFDGTLAAEYAIDRYRSDIGPLYIEAGRLKGSPTIRTFSLLVDAIVLLLLGLARTNIEGVIYRLEPVPAVYSQAKHRLVAQKVDIISRAANKAMLMSDLHMREPSGDQALYTSNVARIEEVRGDLISHLGEMLLDRVMTFNPRRRQVLHSALPSAMHQLVQVSRLVALAQLCSFAGGPVRLTEEWLSSRGVDLAFIPEIMALTPNGSYESFMRRMVGSVEFFLNCWPDQLLTHLVHSRRFDGEYLHVLLRKHVGGWFETDYVIKDLLDFAGEGGWSVQKNTGFKLKAGKGERAGDVDVVLTRSSNETLFVQVKFVQRYWMPYLCDELLLVRPMRNSTGASSSGIVKGLQQLRSVYRRRDEEEVIREVSAALGWTYDEARKRLQEGTYVLVHNAMLLDYAVHEGAVLYEWNSFRNLIRGGGRSINLVTGEEKRVALCAPLSDPLALGQEFLAMNGDDNSGIPFEAIRAHAQVNVDAELIDLVLPIF